VLEKIRSYLKGFWDTLGQVPFVWPWDTRKVSKRLHNLDFYIMDKMSEKLMIQMIKKGGK